MSELTFATAGNAERAIEFDPDNASVKHGAAIFFETIRVVEEKDADNGTSHPLAVRAWILDGPDAGAYEEDLWVFPKGIRSKIAPEPGAKSAGRLEVYKDARGMKRVGLTSMTDEQRELAQAKNDELKPTDASNAPASGKAASVVGSTAGADDEPPF